MGIMAGISDIPTYVCPVIVSTTSKEGNFYETYCYVGIVISIDRKYRAKLMEPSADLMNM
jgi:hypothetical protein